MASSSSLNSTTTLTSISSSSISASLTASMSSDVTTITSTITTTPSDPITSTEEPEPEPEPEDPTSTTTSTISSTTTSSSTTSTISSTTTSSTPSSTSSTAESSTESSSEPESVSSIITTTLITTDSAGQSITTVQVTGTVVPNPEAQDGGSGVSTGAIIGGVIGGVVLLALIIAAIVIVRRKKKRDEFEANIFDPDKNIQRPKSAVAGQDFDIMAAALPEAARSVTPYSYTPTGPTSTAHGSSVAGQPEVQPGRPPSTFYTDYSSQSGGPHYPPSSPGGDYLPNPYGPGYQHHPASLVPGAAAAGALGGAALGRGPTSASTNSSSMYGPSSNYSYPQSQTSPPPPVGGAAPLNPRAAKEREAFSRSGHFTVANQTEGPTSPVIVHQDGGRAPIPDVDEDSEIPPTYDSIPQNNPRT